MSRWYDWASCLAPHASESGSLWQAVETPRGQPASQALRGHGTRVRGLVPYLGGVPQPPQGGFVARERLRGATLVACLWYAGGGCLSW